MSQITRPHVASWIISNEAASLSGVLTTTLVATSVYLYAFETLAPITVSGGKWRMGVTVGGTTDIGIYDVNGNLLAHSGAITNVASTDMTANFLASIVLAPGQYFMALLPSSSSDTYLGITSSASLTPTSRVRIAVNTAASALPATTGGYTDKPSRVPAMALTISGGLT